MQRVLRTPADVTALAALLRARALPVTVTITKGLPRTTPQNRLQYKWYQEVAEQLGDRDAEDVRAHAKLHYGVPILRAENDAYREKYDRLIKPLSYEKKLAMMKEPFSYPVTSVMTVRQETAFLDAFAAHYVAQGVRLTIPEDGRYARGQA